MNRAAATDVPQGLTLASESAAAAGAALVPAPDSVTEDENSDSNSALHGTNLEVANEPLTGADLDAVVAARKKTERRARKAVRDAKAEEARRTKALEHQKQVLRASGVVYNIETESTTPERKPFIDGEARAIRIGAFVQVEPDLGITGPARYGGKGFITDVTGYGSATSVVVKYIKLGSVEQIETGIDIRRVTELDSPFLKQIKESLVTRLCCMNVCVE